LKRVVLFFPPFFSPPTPERPPFSTPRADPQSSGTPRLLLHRVLVHEASVFHGGLSSFPPFAVNYFFFTRLSVPPFSVRGWEMGPPFFVRSLVSSPSPLYPRVFFSFSRGCVLEGLQHLANVLFARRSPLSLLLFKQRGVERGDFFRDLFFFFFGTKRPLCTTCRDLSPQYIARQTLRFFSVAPRRSNGSFRFARPHLLAEGPFPETKSFLPPPRELPHSGAPFVYSPSLRFFESNNNERLICAVLL